MQAAQKPRRVILFDELRGVMILSMLAYHICYDLAEVVRLPGMGWWGGFIPTRRGGGS